MRNLQRANYLSTRSFSVPFPALFRNSSNNYLDLSQTNLPRGTRNAEGVIIKSSGLQVLFVVTLYFVCIDRFLFLFLLVVGKFSFRLYCSTASQLRLRCCFT